MKPKRSLLDLGRAGQPLKGLEVIDLHGHLGAYRLAIPDLSSTGMVAVMDRLGVARIVCSHMQCMASETEWGNREVWRAMREQPGRILGYLSVWPTEARTVRRQARKWLARGFTGFKLHSHNGFPYTTPAYAPLFELAHEQRRPVLFHTWGNAKELETIRDLARAHPQAAFLLGHSGSADEKDYIRVAKDTENLYLETCFSVAPRGLIERLADGVGAHKVVWGSDAYYYGQAQQFGRVLGARLSDEAKIQILSVNAHRILDRIR